MSTIAEGAVTERLVRVETKIDLLLADIAPRHIDHETRIRLLETGHVTLTTQVKTWLSFAAVGTTAGGGVLGTVFAHLTGA